MIPPNQIPNDKSFTSLLAICCLATFGCYFAVATRLPVVPLYAREFGVTTSQIGVINSAFFLTAGVFALPSGLMSDLFGRRRLALIGVTILILGMVLLYFSRSFVHLAGLYLLLGCGTAAFGPTMMSWVAVISPATHLGRSYGWYTTALFCGLGLGPAAGGALGQWIGLKPVFLVAAGLLVINLLTVGRFLPSQIKTTHQRKNGAQWRTDAGKVLKNRPLIGCWLATFGGCAVAGMFIAFLPLHAADKGLDVGEIGIVFLVQALTNALARIPFGTLSDRVSQRKRLVLAGIVLISISIAAFALAANLVHFLLAGLALGGSMAIAFTSIGALIAETVAAEYRGLAMGGYNSCVYFGMMSGAVGFGPVIEMLGFASGFALTGLFNLPFIVAFIWCLTEYSRK